MGDKPFYVAFDPPPPPLPPSTPVHIWLIHIFPVCADTNFEYNKEFLSKNPTPNTHPPPVPLYKRQESKSQDTFVRRCPL